MHRHNCHGRACPWASTRKRRGHADGEDEIEITEAETTANARLIATAPELLAVLQKTSCYCPINLQDEIRAIIAKAKGRT
jgi:hypothetical protein